MATEVLSSDEDDIDEMNNEYLANLARMTVKNSGAQGVNVTAAIEDYVDSDSVSGWSIEIQFATCTFVTNQTRNNLSNVAYFYCKVCNIMIHDV